MLRNQKCSWFQDKPDLRVPGQGKQQRLRDAEGPSCPVPTLPSRFPGEQPSASPAPAHSPAKNFPAHTYTYSPRSARPAQPHSSPPRTQCQQIAAGGRFAELSVSVKSQGSDNKIPRVSSAPGHHLEALTLACTITGTEGIFRWEPKPEIPTRAAFSSAPS